MKGAVMSTKNWSNILSISARILLAFIFLFGQTAQATQDQNGKDKLGSKPAAKSQQAPTKPSAAAGEKIATAEEETVTAGKSSAEEHSQHRGQDEGIKVHGHWTIEVRNPDGTTVTHREFENSLQASGATVLANVLNSGSTPGGWAIALDGIPTSPWLPQDNALQLGIQYVSNTSAVIIRSGFFLFQPADSNVFFNLISNSTGNGQLVVSGSALAAQSGSVSIVSTYFNTCGNVFSPTNCANHTGGESEYLFTKFTAVTLSSPVQVLAGQTVAATVTISFS
jgi:hypothetical protein